jgi:serralysin
VPNSSVTTGFTLNLTDRAAGKSANKAATSVVDSDPIVTVVQIDDHYELKAVSSGTGPLIELNGSPVTVGQFPAGWTPVGATETGDGYEIAWSAPGANEYVVWNTDSNGDYTSAATGILSGASPTLAAVEANFGETFTGSGPPASTTMIATNGTTTLAQVGNLFELNPAGGGTGPLLELNGGVVTAGQFAAGWTPVGAMRTANGYEVAFSAPVPGQSGEKQYVAWNTDSNGDYTSAPTGILSGASYALEELEATFGEDLNGDGTVGPTMTTIADNSATTLAEVANQFELNPVSGGTGPFLELNGSPVTAGQFVAGWTPVGATQTGNGYEVAFSAPVPGQSGQKQYVVWNTDSNGDYTSAATGILSGASPTLAAVEANFDETSPGETFPGAGPPASTTTIATNGTTTLAQVGDLFELNPAGGGTGPLLELNGGVVTAGQFAAGWTPVGAMQMVNGYEVAFGSPVPGQPGQHQFVVWNTDGADDYTSAATGILPGTSPMLEALEANFGEAFPGAGPPPSTTVTTTNAATTLKIGFPVVRKQTVNFADLPTGCPRAVDLIDPNGFSSKIENFASPDSVDLSGDWNYLHFSENSGAALRTLTLQNVASHADFSLKFVGDYARSDFHIISGATTTTIAHT